MSDALPATLRAGVGCRCTPWIFRWHQSPADAGPNQQVVGHESRPSRRKILPKSWLVPLAANPRPELMQGKRRPKRQQRKDAVAVVAGIVDPGGSCARFAANPRPGLMRARRGPMRRQRKDAVAVV